MCILDVEGFPCKIASSGYTPTIWVRHCPLEDMLDDTWYFQSLKFCCSQFLTFTCFDNLMGKMTSPCFDLCIPDS